MLDFNFYKQVEDNRYVIKHESDEKYFRAITPNLIEFTDNPEEAIKFSDIEDAWGMAYEIHQWLDGWYKVVEV